MVALNEQLCYLTAPAPRNHAPVAAGIGDKVEFYRPLNLPV
jgi:hypothetical protein